MSPIYTGRGDDGTTGYLGEGRLSKYDLRIETLGVIDEASAAAGLARAAAGSLTVKSLLLRVQRELYTAMAEVASAPEHAGRFQKIGQDQVLHLENEIAALQEKVSLPGEFIIPGDVLSGAALSLARTVIRRAERRLTELTAAGKLQDTMLLTYFNRLSTLFFVMELYEVQASGKDTPTLARDSQE